MISQLSDSAADLECLLFSPSGQILINVEFFGTELCQNHTQFHALHLHPNPLQLHLAVKLSTRPGGPYRGTSTDEIADIYVQELKLDI